MITGDVQGAFLESPLKEHVFITLDKSLAGLLCSLRPYFLAFKKKDGSLSCVLKRGTRTGGKQTVVDTVEPTRAENPHKRRQSGTES
jgi:hypothetical protein